MIIVKNNIIPFKGFAAINICGILFVRKDATIKDYDRMINHESIHSKLIFEMAIIFFYLWYIMEWFIKLFKYGDSTGGDGGAYRNISFEREAYDNENNLNYIKTRKKYSWCYYLTHKTHGKK